MNLNLNPTPILLQFQPVTVRLCDLITNPSTELDEFGMPDNSIDMSVDNLTGRVPRPAPDSCPSSIRHPFTHIQLDQATTEANDPSMIEAFTDPYSPSTQPVFGSAVVFSTKSTRYRLTGEKLSGSSTKVDDSGLGSISTDIGLDFLIETVQESVVNSPSDTTQGSIAGYPMINYVPKFDRSAPFVSTTAKSGKPLVEKNSTSTIGSSILIGTEKKPAYDHTLSQESDRENFTEHEVCHNEALPPEEMDSQTVQVEAHAKGQDAPVSVDARDPNQEIIFTRLPSPMVRLIDKAEDEYRPRNKLDKLKRFVKEPRRTLKTLVSNQPVVTASWLGPDTAPMPSLTRRHIKVGERVRRQCSWLKSC